VKILHIDDEKVNLELSTIVLRKFGYDVVGCTDPKQTVSLLEEHKPALLILDIVMPEVNGFEIFDDLKANDTPVPILFLTGWPDSFDMNKEDTVNRWTTMFSDGMTDILYKPYEPADLRNKVEGLIGPLEDEPPAEDHAESE